LYQSVDSARRGLIIDKSKGNILKVDRHKYVRKVFHGLTEMSPEDRKHNYLSAFSQMPTFTESNFVNIDTSFLFIGTYYVTNISCNYI